MSDTTELRTRAATLADAAAIAAIYNEGIADRIATFETEPRSAGQIAEWFTGRQLVIVAEIEEPGPAAFAASFPYSPRPCYAGIGEFSVYARRDYRGRGAGRAVLAALIEAATAAGLHKLTTRRNRFGPRKGNFRIGQALSKKRCRLMRNRGSNPAPSSKESGANLTSGPWRHPLPAVPRFLRADVQRSVRRRPCDL